MFKRKRLLGILLMMIALTFVGSGLTRTVVGAGVTGAVKTQKGRCVNGSTSNAEGWGMTCQSAKDNAEANACSTCHTHHQSCMGIIQWSCSGFTAHVTIQCCD